MPEEKKKREREEGRSFVSCYKREKRMYVWISSNMTRLAIFQDVNFIRRTYVFVKVAGSRVSLTLVSYRQARDALTTLPGRRRVFLERKIAPLHLSRCSTLRRHMLVLLCLFVLTRLASSSRNAFFSIYSLGRLFISCSDATDAPCEGEFWRVVNFINDPVSWPT